MGQRYGGGSSGQYGGAPGGLDNPASVAITGGTGVLIDLGICSLPFVMAPTGTMGNNGAVTLGTALGRIVPKCFMYFPAGAVASGVPAAAGWLYTEMSSTTVGVVFNNTYTSPGMPTVPTSKTAFVTTGPGAFTGVIVEVQGPTIKVPANTLGLYGALYVDTIHSGNSTAGAKTARVEFGANDLTGDRYYSADMSTNQRMGSTNVIANQGQTNQQGGYSTGNAVGSNAALVVNGTQDTTTDRFVVATLTNGVATNYLIQEYFAVAFRRTVGA